MSTLSPRQMFLLDLACHPILEAFDATPFLVGTAQQPRGDRAPRDVDVRLILDDKRHARLVKAIGVAGVAFLGIAIGHYLAAVTGLPIDFQIQQRTAANTHHDGPRNPLGGRTLANWPGDAPLAGGGDRG